MKNKNGTKMALSFLLLCFFLVTVSIGAYAQKTVSGNVTDEGGLPLPGVTVVEKGTTKGTVTDADGDFTISGVSNDATLVFSFVGMGVQEMKVGNQTTFNVVMKEQSIGLEEVVAVGYGVQKKESVVGSIEQATNEELRRSGSSTDLTENLVGQIPGMVALTSSGEPGGILTGESSTEIYIRGQNTWNGGQPLILVDGVERNMNNVDVNEVESISVLKDASATAVFGVKGANGVILITTKRGEAGKTKLNFNYTTTGKMLSRQPDKLESYAAMMAKNEIIEREGVLNEPSWGAYVPYEIVQRYRKPQSEEYAEIYPNVDWEDAMFKDIGFSHRMTLNAQGGSKAVRYFGSLAYLHEGDMFKDYDNFKTYDPNYDYDRFNFRSNIDIELTKSTQLKINLSGYYSLKNTNYNNEGSTSRADAWMWKATYGMAPNLFLPKYKDGRWGAYQEGGNNTVNPIAAVYNIGVRQTRQTQLNADFKLVQDLSFITKGLSARASLFYDNSIRSEGGIYDVQNSIRPAEARTNVPFKQIYPMKYEGPDQDPSEYTVLLPIGDEEYDWALNPWSVRQENITSANWTSYIPVSRRMMYEFQMNYARTFENHNVSAMGVFKREEYAVGSMFKNYREDWVFRTTYGYDSRYLFEANGAYNGSEQFGPGYRFEFFPSLAVGWYVSNEEFFNIDWVDRLKIRYSIGRVGDDKVSGSRWLYESQLAYGGRARLSNSTSGWSPYNFYREAVVGNPDIHWESALKTNFGVEFGVLKNLFTLNFDYFTEDRTDILMSGGSRNVPPFFGATPPSANLGHVKSKGFEIELGFNKRINNKANVWAKLALTHNENEVIERDDAPLQFEYLKAKGYPIGQQKRLLSTDFYNNWDEVYASVPTENNDADKLPGYYNLVDFNADGIIKNSEDTPPIGYSGVPQNTGSFTLGADYGGFSFMIQFFGVNNANRYVGFNNYQNDIDIVFGHVADYWSKDNPDATSFLPRWKTQAENIGDYYLYDASYLRLQNAEIAYTFNDLDWVKRAGFSNFRLFLNGNNLFFWSKLPDDRTTTYSGGSATQGAYPTVKRVNLGIDLSF
ncbi:TonB-dependent receptor [Prolixibacteraceae bacterium Z1-6]|uniref:TonB-dependent receptor n=1 Tax=Draconibacterium aestuarii TaxID=2998507 RepID=A0A9X3J474_9BACT|nr:TonB-dependent receptor [Prolixibacteraceae bacterium Z1-6]